MNVRQCFLAAIAAVVFLAFSAGALGAARFVPIPEPDLGDAPVVTSDVLDLGSEQMLVGRDGEVTIYDEEFAVRGIIRGFLGQVTALAVDDLTGDGRVEVVAATDNAGALYVYARNSDGTQWSRIAEPYYLWQPAQTLITGALSGQMHSIVAVDEEKQLRVLYWDDSSLSETWKSVSGQQVRWAALVDLAGSGFRKLVFTEPTGYIAVYAYADGEMHLVSERYPWGPILMLGWKHAAEGLPGELYVVTGEHMVYYWQWKDSDMQLKGSFEAEALGRRIGWVPNRGLWSTTPEGVQFFSIESSDLTLQERKKGLTGIALEPLADHWLAQDSGGMWQVWRPVDLEYLQVFVEGQMRPPPALYWDGDLAYLCLEDLAALLDIAVQDGRVLVHPRTGRSVAVEPNERWATYAEKTALPLEQAPIVEDGVVFVPPDIAGYVGWRAEYDPDKRRLEFEPSLDWFDSKQD